MSAPSKFSSMLDHVIGQALPVSLPPDLTLIELGLTEHVFCVVRPVNGRDQLNGEPQTWRTLADICQTAGNQYEIQLDGRQVTIRVGCGSIQRLSVLLPEQLLLRRVGWSRANMRSLAHVLTAEAVYQGHPMCYTIPSQDVATWLTVARIKQSALRYAWDGA